MAQPSTHYDASHPKALEAPPPFDWELVPEGERVLVAVSGGADSLALLRMLHGQRDIVVGHINHGLRGEESEADANFVLQCCAELGLPCVLQHVYVPQRDGTFSEAAARTVRYAALLQMARDHSCSHLATGHTASDNLETILLNFLRGATVEGLGGIKTRTSLGDITLVRPLWQATREQVQELLQRAGWTWRDDSSNASTRYARNRVRHELLPLLAQHSGGKSLDALARQTARASQLWRDDIAWMNTAAREHLAAITVQEQPHLLALDGVAFRDFPVALQRRVLREAARRVQGNVQDIGSEHIEAARRHIVADGRRAVWQWRRGLSVEWTGAMSGNRIRLWLVGETVKNSTAASQKLTSPTRLLTDTETNQLTT
ncbi:MAG TPA: tRNA lysidine(34) synthetase TilS [Abditibacteriaceae bacterium]|jgi:tRNA(Ile)-lysidine synthase